MRGLGNTISRSCTNILVLETITVPGRAVGAAKNVPASNSIGGRVYKSESGFGLGLRLYANVRAAGDQRRLVILFFMKELKR